MGSPGYSDLKRKILDASIALVAEHGVRSVSFREVARRAGVSHQAPYHHFGNYEGILHAIAREGFITLAEAVRNAAEAAGADSLQALTEAGVAYVRFARDHVGHFRVMFQQSLVDVHSRDTPIAEAQWPYDNLVRLVTAVVRDGYGGGLSVEVLSQLCWATVHGFATLLVEGILGAKHSLTRKQANQLTREVVEAVARLLAHPNPRRRRPTRRRT